jgi:hypothetical protein
MENIEELESVGKINSKYFRKEGLKLFLIGIASMFGGILVMYIWMNVKFGNTIILNLAVLLLFIVLLITGLINLVKGIKSLLLSPPKAPRDIKMLIDAYYTPFFFDVARCFEKGPGKSVSWLKSYVCLLKKDRDSIGLYPDFVKYKMLMASDLSLELRTLVATKFNDASEIKFKSNEIKELSNSNNIQTCMVKFNIEIYKGSFGSSYFPLTQIGNMEIVENVKTCMINNRFYIYDIEWHGKPTLL